MSEQTVVVGDVGGTNSRFAIAQLKLGRVELQHVRIEPSDQYTSFGDALGSYLAAVDIKPDAASFGFAGPVEGDVVQLTNRDWRIDASDLCARFGFCEAVLSNDFAAMARSAPELDGDDVRILSDRPGRPSDPCVVAGPGTGFGLATLLRSKGGWSVVGGEGGHQTYAAESELEWEIVKRLHVTHEHVSTEMMSAGVGFPAMLAAIQDIFGLPVVPATPPEIQKLAEAGDEMANALCRVRARAVMARLGDGVMAVNGRSAAYLAGGVAVRLAKWMGEPETLARFYNRGPMAHYMSVVPIRLIVAPDAAMIGAARLYYDRELMR